MAEFTFLKNAVSRRWTVLAPRRTKRPGIVNGKEPPCPFCPGQEKEEEVFRFSVLSSRLSESSQSVHQLTGKQITGKLEAENRQLKTDDWLVRVFKNKYPFAPIHEVIIHSPDHEKNFDTLSQTQNELLLQTFRHRFSEHMHTGQVVIFHNHGQKAGESLPHPHSQLVVIPERINLENFRLETGIKGLAREKTYETSDFVLFCPETSLWPDEVWIAPRKRKRMFGEITDEEISDLALVIKRLVHIFTVAHRNEFPFNLIISSGNDFYLRMVPRLKRIGGFELATDVYVNTQDPKETLRFIKTHFASPDIQRIKKEHIAEYHRSV